jgi:Tfp pilus assembly protein PilF
MRIPFQASLWIFLLSTATCLQIQAAIAPRSVIEQAPLALAAEYYLEHRQFERALEMYRTLLQQDAVVPRYWERVATLALYLEGRNSAQEIVQRFLSLPDSMKRNWDSVDHFLEGLYGSFLTDRGQALYLQGMVRFERGDCEGALPFFKQSLDQESNHLVVMRHQTECEMKKAAYSQAYETIKNRYALNPFNKAVAESLAELHLYFGSVSSALELVKEYSRFRVPSPRLLVVQAIALARKTDREAAWQAFRKVDQAIPQKEMPAIVYWEKAKLLETDPKRNSPLAKSQLTSWLKHFQGTPEKKKEFDPYKSATLRDPAMKWLAELTTSEPASAPKTKTR